MKTPIQEAEQAILGPPGSLPKAQPAPHSYRLHTPPSFLWTATVVSCASRLGPPWTTRRPRPTSLLWLPR